ncbi:MULTISPECIES: TetR/AcrR family transcriptional regulator C-terminal domain-containing protein [Sphingomonadales]|uniref:TetR-family transcriptional regulator n=3 Tax=Sphingomonadaceae TaxID=41297 RepID=D4Z928_SPHIU|nr:MULTISPECIES: TetR/AcrR family transcriptional regulator C-terminal domain-containing protein [Sphingomonadaceae]EQB07158.1 hypothetical protein L286_04380 [Sphingobium sp. HDIP04]MBB4046945.1 AcrR family transcriptional regulator [Sphingomonas zeae]NUU49050.1 TetR/AcrR family transcriptional regulator [Sphingomonas zeae]BAI99110.1 TetR-family transcriptional regulator [Sphingobium indicum UT26S]
MTMASQQSSDKRTHILNVAGRLFLENGFAGTSMGDIAKAGAGSKGTLYTYFDSKEQMFDEFMHSEIEARANLVFELPEHTENPAAALRELGVRYLKLTTHPTVSAILRLVIAEASRFPKIGKLFYDGGPKAAHDKLTAFLHRCVEQGHFAIPDVSLAASQFVRLCQADIWLEFLLCVREAPDSGEINYLVDSAVEAFAAAYGRRSGASAPQSHQ